MRNIDSYCSALLLLAAGLLAGAPAQAQTTRTLVTTTDGSAAPASENPAALRLTQPPAPEASAAFYDGSHKDLHQSLAWMQETNAVAPTYWNLYTEARIRLQMQDYAGAQTTAEQAYKLALKAMPASQAYVQLSAAVVNKARTLAQR
ncbi:hypothetical protein GKZ68_02715 [Hymenobacter sp. BRD128]|uniref:hypothetical protein n=1 Tax=Hymenobacter sp. BRD128 TaxID=2675878 RepID=UPI001566D556|nr:hypothetical protein [Hymenobacter sp. BRD128]QKG55642.1 hypothetical protein GKZ68_02715 [Hymenobacter sp. BRD128]